MQRQSSFVAPKFIRIEAALEGEYLHLEVWEVDDPRFLSRAEHAQVFPHCTPSDAIEVIAATLDGWGLPDPF